MGLKSIVGDNTSKFGGGGTPLHELDISGKCVISKKIQTCDMFHGITRENSAYLLYPMPKCSENLHKFLEELGNLWGISKNFRNTSKLFLRSLYNF